MSRPGDDEHTFVFPPSPVECGCVTAGASLDTFHPAVAEWFRRTFPAGPTPAQALGWPAIARGEDTLLAAPTGISWRSIPSMPMQ